MKILVQVLSKFLNSSKIFQFDLQTGFEFKIKDSKKKVTLNKQNFQQKFERTEHSKTFKVTNNF